MNSGPVGRAGLVPARIARSAMMSVNVTNPFLKNRHCLRQSGQGQALPLLNVILLTRSAQAAEIAVLHLQRQTSHLLPRARAPRSESLPRPPMEGPCDPPTPLRSPEY